MPATTKMHLNHTNASGLDSSDVVLSCEDKSAFEDLRRELRSHYAPSSRSEQELVDALAVAEWRVMRCRRTETAFLDQCAKEMTKADPNLEPELAIANIFMDTVYAKKISLFMRYQAAIERAANQALKRVQDMIKTRQAPAPAVSDVPKVIDFGFVSQSELPQTVILPVRPNPVPAPPLDRGGVPAKCA